MNVDYIQKRYPEAKVTGVSIAGLYFMRRTTMA